MIECYTGTPGSGKSFHVANELYFLIGRKNVILNFPLNEDIVGRLKKKHGKNKDVIYLDNSEITVDYLVKYARKHHKMGVEKQTYIIIDEAQVKFNCREFGAKDRQLWCNFFAQHRKLGFEVILITQFVRLLDRQVRCLIEIETEHRKVNNYGLGGMIVTLLTWRTWFAAISYWSGGNALKVGSTMYPFSARKAKIYDSFHMFTDDSFKLATTV